MEEVVSPLGFINYNDLKRDILFFDKILYDPLFSKDLIATYEWANFNDNYNQDIRVIGQNEYLTTIEYLINECLLQKIDIYKELDDGLLLTDASENKQLSVLKDEYAFLNDFKDAFDELMNKEINSLNIKYCYSAANTYSDLIIRLYSKYRSNFITDTTLSALNTKDKTRAEHQEYFKSFFPEQKGKIKNQEVLSVMINSIPIPDPIIPFDEILDWKNQSNNRLMYLRLKRWMSKNLDPDISRKELKQELEYLTLEFENRMKLEKMKYRLSNFEAIFVTPLKIVEDVIKFTWSNVPKTLVSVKKNKMNLLISETKAPGKEIAYLSAVKDKFGKTK